MKEIFEQLKTLISEKTGVEKSDIIPEAFFSEDLNIDELELTEIITELEDRFDIILDVDMEDLKTVSDLLHAIAEKTE